MTKLYPLALHIFRRDLRLHDNTSLIKALKSSNTVIPCFIFDKRQIENNAYKSNNCIQFMAHSLHELNAALQKKNSKLYFFYGISEEVVAQLLVKLNIKAVFTNRDYTSFSRERDLKIKKICHDLDVDFYSCPDALLNEPEKIMKSNFQPYNIFTPFFKKSIQMQVPTPKNNTHNNYYQKSIILEDKVTLKKLLKINNPNIILKGGRDEALTQLRKIKNLHDYQAIRNFPSTPGTTLLSAHNKFGTLSIRELYTEITRNFNQEHELIKELYWRDFFTHIAFHYPHVFFGSFYEKYDAIHWSENHKHFDAWCKGQTGFPIIDAGMRELNATGFMHNRVRMITASFLTKDLHINWRWGEKYFAQNLIDYDPAINNGNWQWSASTGCDAQPYFRIFNPWIQQSKFDADCIYIKKWIPELATMAPKFIHKLNKTEARSMDYPTPIINHSIESRKAKISYKYINDKKSETQGQA